MIVVILGIYYTSSPEDTIWQYLVYIFYGLGITWTLLVYRRSSGSALKFGNVFNQGFRCFIVVTLVMAIFYGLFNYQHPEFADEIANTYKEELVKKNDKTPVEIDNEMATFKKQYTLKLVSAAIFGYLIVGAGITAVGSAIVTRRK